MSGFFYVFFQPLTYGQEPEFLTTQENHEAQMLPHLITQHA